MGDSTFHGLKRYIVRLDFKNGGYSIDIKNGRERLKMDDVIVEILIYTYV